MTLSSLFQKKDKRWFEKVFDQHYEKIRNFLYYRTGDIEKAEDLTQDVFVKLWENRTEIDNKRVHSYLYKIAQNLLLTNITGKNYTLLLKLRLIAILHQKRLSF